jgi:hypothetical protein
VSWIPKKESWDPASLRLEWGAVIECFSGKKVLFCTNLKPRNEERWTSKSFAGPSFADLKSLLQKHVRLCNADEAVAVAHRFLHLRTDYSFKHRSYRFGFRELLFRLMVIILEDGFIHPSYPVLGWLLMVHIHCAPHWFPHSIHEEFLLSLVYDVAKAPFREVLPPKDSPATLIELSDLKTLSPWEASLLSSIQFRTSLQGTKGDKMFMQQIARLWLKRFQKQKFKGELGNNRVFEIWTQLSSIGSFVSPAKVFFFFSFEFQ